ncbi:RNA polymerase sigma factor [Mesohalobacter halotolerans]|uniref:RNA polymerase sigma factor n=1 Tax=Mesohalobacter halotolerans TaxID=1883405 RepID=A0A4U5TUU3_9FLAO|nr:RNA polymerase sigma factor [Mesohalobacter halotolerans]MBS3737479.1 RNA polymerase sigma factor [Psychroflexus sp.]NBC58720.1 sigma-70 family RNA polymerase sigma factor [Bacteroidota bacterium]TKS57058.1 RNA polymerase sigma factor [Mesohalobacter halotolerans]
MKLKKLIKQCQDKELKAQKALYEIYSSKLFSLCLKYSKNYAEAQDNLQDAFISIYENIHQFKHKGSFEGWMKRIVINTALQRYRNQKVFSLNYEENLIQPENDYSENNISLNELLKCIQELPNRYRMVFNLYVLDGYSHKEIAEMMEISVGTSKSNLARGRQILKDKVNSILHKENINKAAKTL